MSKDRATSLASLKVGCCPGVSTEQVLSKGRKETACTEYLPDARNRARSGVSCDPHDSPVSRFITPILQMCKQRLREENLPIVA